MNDSESLSLFENIDESISTEIKNPFDPTKIDITVKPLIIDSLIKRMRAKPNPRIDLNTEFQRRGDIWKEQAQSRLIESLLVRIPLPAFYFDGTDDEMWKVVDGLQRLYSLKNFVIDQTLKLTDLEYLKNYNGATFGDLPAFLQTRIEETQITAYIINPGSPSEVKFNIFKRINTGGLVLTPQEIRHALNQGIPSDFVKELAELEEFKKATAFSFVDAKRMEDRDLVARFIGFYYGYEKYLSDLDSFLNDGMTNLKIISPSARDKIKTDFKKAMNAAYEIFENDAFRKRYDKTDPRKPINKALFDAWSVNLARLSDIDIQVIISRKADVKSKFIKLMNEDKAFEKSVSSATGDYKAVAIRFDDINRLIKEVLNDNKGSAHQLQVF